MKSIPITFVNLTILHGQLIICKVVGEQIPYIETDILHLKRYTMCSAIQYCIVEEGS